MISALRYTLHTLSSVLITSSAGETNTVETMPYIPGTAVLGSLAHRYMKEYCANTAPHTDAVFRRWFLEGGLTFTNAYIMNSDTQAVYFPAPHSVVKKKYGNPKSCPAFDLLFTDPEEIEESTEGMQGKFIAITGKTIETGKIGRSLNFHHARDPKTGTPEDERFFNYESLDAGQRFVGWIVGDATELQAFRDFLEQKALVPEATLYVGRSKNAQYGKVEMQVEANLMQEFFSEIPREDPDELDIEDGGVSMTLLSDLILYNGYGFAVADIRELEKHLPCAIAPEKSFLKTGIVEGFYSAWGLPRPTETCFQAGSTFLLRASEKDEEALLALQQQGIGERRHEGFGRVVFDWQQPQDTLTKTEPDSTKKNIAPPQCSMPAIARQIIENILKDTIEKHVQLKALKKAKDFLTHRPPNKSLIGRLEAIVRQHERSSAELALVEYLQKMLNDPPKTSALALRKTARDQLRRCRDTRHSQTLFDFLNKAHDEISVSRILQNRSDIVNLATEAQLSLAEDRAFGEHLAYRYFITFFAALQKMVKTTEKGGR